MNLERIRFLKNHLCARLRSSSAVGVNLNPASTSASFGRSRICGLRTGGALEILKMSLDSSHEYSASRDLNGTARSVGSVVPAEEAYVDDAVQALRRSEVIAVPTDTLYGLACDACSGIAIQKIYEIKGRKATRPLAICVADIEDIEQYAFMKHLPEGLLKALLPGPVTLILPLHNTSRLHRSLNPGLSSVAVRIPDNHFIRYVSRKFGGALALTSANVSTKPSTVRVEEFEDLWRHCALVFDAGQIPAARSGSTILDVTVPGCFSVIRIGIASEETLQHLHKYGLTEQPISNTGSV